MDFILYFFLFSFFGWIMESVYAFFTYKKIVSKQTLLKCPLCTIYGIGGIVIMLLLEPVSSSYILLFCGGFFAASSVEYLVAAYYEHFFKVMWWDYSNSKGNLDGKVCVFNSVMWGFVTIAFVKFLLPFSEMLVSSVDGYLKIILTALLLSVFLKDYKNTMIDLKKFAANEKSEAERKFVALKRINC